jgi:thiosulfate dehydrogenase [quinone] large subunit
MTKRQLAASKRQTAELERRTFLQKAAAAGVVALTAFTLGGLVSALGRLLHSVHPSGAVASLPDAGAPSRASPATGGHAPAVTGTTTSPTAPTSTATVAVPKGTRIGPAADVPVGGAASFTDPAQQIPALVVQIKSGDFRAFSAVCPHAGCTVQFDGTSDVFACPCHGSVFSATTGAVLQGPAPTGLSPIAVALGPNGQLYVDG